MPSVKMFTGERIPLEMHKVRIVQKLRLIPIEDRLKAITEAGNNTGRSISFLRIRGGPANTSSRRPMSLRAASFPRIFILRQRRRISPSAEVRLKRSSSTRALKSKAPVRSKATPISPSCGRSSRRMGLKRFRSCVLSSERTSWAGSLFL